MSLQMSTARTIARRVAANVATNGDSPAAPFAHDFDFFGGAEQLIDYPGTEVIIAGPYETGKTIAALHKLHTLLWTTKNARGLMVRKTYKSLLPSAVVTYEHKVLPIPPGHPDCPVMVFGGSRPDWYDYPNGARLVLGGMDNADKFLSAEFDFIYVNQAEEIDVDDWEKLTGRATGRAGNTEHPQIIGDCNPSHPYHWILEREPPFQQFCRSGGTSWPFRVPLPPSGTGHPRPRKTRRARRCCA